MPTTRADDPFLVTLITDPQVRRFPGGVVQQGEVQAVLARYHDLGSDEYAWTIFERDAPNPVGLMSLTHHKDGVDYELSYQLCPAFWAGGLATEAGRAVLNFASEQLGLSRVIAETQQANTASVALLKRLGMTQVQNTLRFGAMQAIYST